MISVKNATKYILFWESAIIYSYIHDFFTEILLFTIRLKKSDNFDFDCTSKAKPTDLVGHSEFFGNFRALTIEKFRGDLVRTLYPSGPAG